VETLFTFDVERSHSSLFIWRKITLFTFDVERSHSSLLMWSHFSHLEWRGVTLHIRCEEESLFTFHLERSHSSHAFDVESSPSSCLMWRGVTLHIL
jgi:hypothetical protein